MTPTPSHSRARALFEALRPHQWAKNLLVFVPLVTAQRFDLPSFVQTSIAFAAFSLAASGGYLVNDVLDAVADRRHPVKRTRPVASGELPAKAALLLAALLFAAALGTARTAASETFTICLVAYTLLSLLYSILLKRIFLADVALLTVLYTLRIQAGAEALVVPLSPSLLAFSLTLFASLALLKRYVEIAENPPTSGQGEEKASARPYRAVDRRPVALVGVAFGAAAAVVLAFYIASPSVVRLYARHTLLWTLCPLLLFWVARLWALARRRALFHDPVAFALKDPVSWLIGGLSLAMLLLARSAP